MQLAISIEPYLATEITVLQRYLDEIAQICRQNPQVRLHFDYFKPNLPALRLVQNYAKQIPVDAHLSRQTIDWHDFQSVSQDVTATAQISHPKQGIVFDLGASISGYEPLIRQAHYVTVMTVKCGQSGQTFNTTALALVPQIRQINPNIIITVDGGVNETNIAQVKQAGVDIAVVGNYAKKCYENGALLAGINRLLQV